ncbi:hypothetical protein GUJ93_ZPchr0009g1062 [Zizania palustris]|uniref:Late embryogenesis abundant protein LEA-2 subgroup domain-containing protein n=1 Tax=Zizania palustris TaxID=103762 RepID=A0A8J5RI23_ZIZPA|nr:hypothetical protein GUJ93_ZPchr0009g1062 [Zizania palustris]
MKGRAAGRCKACGKGQRHAKRRGQGGMKGRKGHRATWRAEGRIATARTMRKIKPSCVLGKCVGGIFHWCPGSAPAKLHVSVDHAAVSRLNFTSGGSLDGTFDVTLRVYNWNKRARADHGSMFWICEACWAFVGILEARCSGCV